MTNLAHGGNHGVSTDEHLVRQHLPMAKALTWTAMRRYQMHANQYDEIHSDALWGLAKAVRRCDGRPLAPYAQRMINGTILQGIRDRTGQRVAHERGEPLKTCVSIDAPRHAPLEDRYEALRVDHTPHTIMRLDLAAEIAKLPLKERQVLLLTYRVDLPQQQIAPMLGVSQMEVSRRLCSARRHLKKTLSEDGMGYAPAPPSMSAIVAGVLSHH